MSTEAHTEPRELGEIIEDAESTQSQAKALMEKIEASAEGSEGQKALQEQLDALKEGYDALKDEREKREAIEGEKAMKAQITTLTEAVQELSKPGQDFQFAGTPDEGQTKASPYADGTHSFFNDIRNAKQGNQKAFDRIAASAEAQGYDVKAMVEGTDSAGGYLVAPEVSDELVRLRTVSTPLRSRFSSVSVNSDTLQISQQTAGLTAAWTDELATKTAADFTFGQISVSNFTAAGLAVVSNQLLADARPSIDGLITADLAKRIAILEEKAFINGTGTAQPRGILNTSGINSTVYTDASPTVQELLPNILTAITQVQTNGLVEPDTIVIHPALWNKIIASREADGHYTLGPGSQRIGRTASDPFPERSLFGYPVVTSFNVPTNLGAGTNETAIVVGNFKSGLILDRQGITIDDSSHVYFTSNQTVFRAEERVGFTAGREPLSFAKITGTGMITTGYPA